MYDCEVGKDVSMAEELSLDEMFDALTDEQKEAVYATIGYCLSSESEIVCAIIAGATKVLNKKWEEMGGCKYV